MNDFYDTAEAVWREWLDGESEPPADLARGLDLAGLPEPYLMADPGPNPLYVLLTNPGRVMVDAAWPLQLRTDIESGRSPISPGMPYRRVSEVLIGEYRSKLSGTAGGRIKAMDDLVLQGGWTELAQFETVPWHSVDFGGGLKHAAATGRWSRSSYVAALRRAFADRPALHVSGSGPIDENAPKTNPWLEFIASIIGLDLGTARTVPLKRSERGTVSVAALIGGTKQVPKMITLRRGTNGLPGTEGRRDLLEEIGGLA